MTAPGAASAAPAAPVADTIAVPANGSLGALDQTLRTDKADFAGVVVDQAHHTITLYASTGASVGKARAALAAQRTSMAAHSAEAVNNTQYTVTYVQVKHSQTSLDQVQKALQSHHTIDGVVWNSVGVDPRLNKVVVGVTKPTVALKTALAKRYGDAVTVQQAAPIHDQMKVTHFDSHKAAVEYAATASKTRTGISPRDVSTHSRLLDSNPWYGGDRIIRIDGNNVIQCTAGLPYADPYYAATQMLVAGHCAPKGYGWKQGYYDGAFHYSSWVNGHFGITGWQQFGPNTIDAALITGDQGAQYGWDVYVNGSTFYGLGGFAYNHAGDAFCADGSFSSENCHGVIDYCNASIQYYGESFTTTGLCLSHSNDGSQLTQPGDSGGPIISGSPMLGRGVVSGGGGTTLYFTPWEQVNLLIGGNPCPC